MPETIRSTRSGSIGRLRMATAIERASFSRSNGNRRPERLRMVSSRSCTRSKVVKRPPHSGHSLRRRIAEPSSDGRESFTWLSGCPQNGQRIEFPDYILWSDLSGSRINGETGAKGQDLLAHLGL